MVCSNRRLQEVNLSWNTFGTAPRKAIPVPQLKGKSAAAPSAPASKDKKLASTTSIKTDGDAAKKKKKQPEPPKEEHE